jgi:hypothetical protein
MKISQKSDERLLNKLISIDGIAVPKAVINRTTWRFDEVTNMYNLFKEFLDSQGYMPLCYYALLKSLPCRMSCSVLISRPVLLLTLIFAIIRFSAVFSSTPGVTFQGCCHYSNWANEIQGQRRYEYSKNRSKRRIG